jgi:hypothetical protein
LQLQLRQVQITSFAIILKLVCGAKLVIEGKKPV